MYVCLWYVVTETTFAHIISTSLNYRCIDYIMLHISDSLAHPASSAVKFVAIYYIYTLLYFLISCQSPFNGEDEDELFEAICNDEPQYPRWLNKHTLNLIDRVSGGGGVMGRW